MKIYSMRDNVSGQWYAPSLYHNDIEATREFNQLMTRKEFDYRKKDYDLFLIGEFNQETGEVIGQAPFRVSSGVNARMLYEEDDLYDL